MTLWAIMNTKDDVDIIDACIRHTLAEGAEHILVSDMQSSDGTREVLDGYVTAGAVTVFEDRSPIHHQVESMTRLARLAYDAGADWVLPVDADEFWVTTDGRTIAEALDALPQSVGRVYARMYQHHDWNLKEPEAKPNPKCTFRSRPDVTVALGNHDVDGVGGDAAYNVLEVREIQYRSFDQFVAKIAKQNATFDPTEGPGQGTHHKQYKGWSRREMAEAWDRIRSVDTVHDPIPSKATR